MKSSTEIREFISGVQCADSLYAINFGFKCTNNVYKLASMADCFWFLDIIVSYQFEKKFRNHRDFQVWTLIMNKTGKGAKVVAEDGNGNKLASQRISYTDFPLSEGLTLWLIDDTIILPKEY